MKLIPAQEVAKHIVQEPALIPVADLSAFEWAFRRWTLGVMIGIAAVFVFCALYGVQAALSFVAG